MKRSIQIFLSGSLALSTGALLLSGFSPAVGQEAKEGASQPASRENLQLIKGYKRWKKVNPKVVMMQPASAYQCAPAGPHQLNSPHLQKYIFVYVNGIGKNAMMQQKPSLFPVGSVIVKEKLTKPDSKEPELMTVMVKRQKGYDPEGGDWEYLVYDGTGTKVQAEGKLENCRSCHQEYPAAKNDHVFRNYYLSQKPLPVFIPTVKP